MGGRAVSGRLNSMEMENGEEAYPESKMYLASLEFGAQQRVGNPHQIKRLICK